MDAKTVLTMEYMEGEPLESALKTMSSEERDALAKTLLEFMFRLSRTLLVHGDPHPGNLLVDGENRIILLDFGCVKEFETETADTILYILDDCRAGRIESVITRMKEMGFGQASTVYPSPTVMGDYLDIILKPLHE